MPHAGRAAALAVGVVLWMAALYGSLHLHRLNWEFGHDICGPWGCAAEPQALAGYHAFWLVLVVPTVALACRAAGPRRGAWLARLAFTLGAVGLVGLVTFASIAWLRDGGDARYTLQRALFVVATSPDLPVVPMLLAGLVGRLVIGRGAPAEPTDEPVEPGRLDGENVGV